MKIAIFDIDDTITFESEYLRKYAPRFLRKNSLNASIINEHGYNLVATYGIQEQLIEKGVSAEDVLLQSKKLCNQFWNHNFIKYNFTQLRPGVSKFISQLQEYGYEVHFLSLRGRKTSSNDNGLNKFIRVKIVPFITKLMLKRNRIKADKIVMVQTEDEKLEYIKYYYPHLVFEDKISILEKINSYDKNIQLVCVTACHNEDKRIPENTIRINNYENDLSKIDSILDKRNMKKEKMTFKNKMIDSYQYCVKAIFHTYFIFKYKPIILGQNNIPPKKGVVFVGNHRHKIDPVFVSISAHRSIHWAALLRMFQGKEDLFSLKSGKLKRHLSAKFITAMGALPIARPTDENYEMINKTTIQGLTDILNMNGCVGFFPEGTINRKPNEYNILPLKSNRVFRMAVETDSYVQPFSIVWIPPEYGIKNQLIIIYSKPINTYRRNRKVIKDIWQETVNSNILYSMELIEKLKCD